MSTCVHPHKHIHKCLSTKEKLLKRNWKSAEETEGVSTSVAGTSNSFSSGVECGFSILNFSGNYCVLRVAMVEKD